MFKPTVISFGEVLWDILPTGKQPGGAPMNVAYHLQTLGFQAGMISKVGNDKLGAELKEFLAEKGVSTRLLQTDMTFPTGTVNVQLDDEGFPSYEIVQPVAWDYIHPTDEATEAVKNADALVFGSLACRSETSRKALFHFLTVAKKKVFDVNLRQPFVSQELVENLLPKADIVKMNDEELDLICGWYVHDMGEAAQMEFLKNKFGLDALIITKGAEGAVAVDGSGLYAQTGFKVTVQDTIGSGDAFLAGFLSKYLTQEPIQQCLEFASYLGAFVATQKGATPNYSPTDLTKNFSQA